MDRRHFSNSFTGEMNRGRHRNRGTAEPHPYIQTGRSAFTENQHLVHPVNNAPRGGYPRTTHWNSETIEYPSSSTMQGSQFQRPFPTPAYDPSSTGNVYLNLTPQENASLSHSSHYDRYNNHNPHGPQGSVTRSRGPLKRKGAETSANYEIGSSSSRFYGTGSSSRSSEMSRRKPSSNLYYGHSEGTYVGNGSVIEDPSRNVRRRSALDLEDNTMRNHVSSYSSSYIYPPNYPANNYGEASNSHVNFGGTSQNWNIGATPHAAHGGVRSAGVSGLSHGNNQLVRGSGPEIRGYHSDSMSGRGITSSQNVHAPSQRARGRRSSHSMRETPSYNVGPSYYSTRWEQVSTEDRLHPHILPSYRHSSQSTRGWGNSYSNGMNGMTAERFRSTASIAHVHGSRFGPEDLMMDSSTFYASSRDFFDQYRDMRLDIDDMSYEELLELEESIGNVNTGLSDEMISSSLIEESHSLRQCCVEETCAICLEEYENEVKIGTVKNCGHNYHADCIRKWLLMRNVCPICKAPAHKD